MAFWIMLIWVFVIWNFFQDNYSTKTLCSDGGYDTKVTFGFMILLFAVPLILVGLRSGFIDTASYIREYKSISAQMSDFSDFANGRDHSKLFYGLEFLFKVYISNDAQVWIFVIAIIQSVMMLIVYKKYSSDPGLSVLLFIISCLICHWMCNGMRQFLAVVILFAFTNWILKNRWYFYIPLIVFLTGLTPVLSKIGVSMDVPWYLDGIHQSAIIMIPIFFCIQGKAFNSKVWAVIALLMVLIVTGGLDDILNTSVEGTTYIKDMEYVEADTGSTFMRALVETVPFAMAFYARKQIKKFDIPPIINLSINASAITSALYIASSFTSGIYVGRLPIYTEMYSLILLPWLINHPYKEYKREITAIMLVAYTAYFFYQVSVTWAGYYQSEILGIGIES